MTESSVPAPAHIILLLAQHAPWWAILLTATPLALLAFVRAVFPQDSGDRMTWWREFWALRRRP
jgi:hypothetical protein